MKKLIAPVAALALAFTPGCMTSRAINKNFAGGLAAVIDALAKDTNSCRLRVNGFGVVIEFDRNGGFNGEASGVTLRPITTLQVQPTK